MKLVGSRRPVGKVGKRPNVPMVEVRFAYDSPLEGGVYCELVSEVKLRCRFR